MGRPDMGWLDAQHGNRSGFCRKRRGRKSKERPLTPVLTEPGPSDRWTRAAPDDFSQLIIFCFGHATPETDADAASAAPSRFPAWLRTERSLPALVRIHLPVA